MACMDCENQCGLLRVYMRMYVCICMHMHARADIHTYMRVRGSAFKHAHRGVLPVCSVYGWQQETPTALHSRR